MGINRWSHCKTDRLCSGRYKTRSVTQIKSITVLTGAECGTDHYLILTKVGQKLQTEKRNKKKIEEQFLKRATLTSSKLN